MISSTGLDVLPPPPVADVAVADIASLGPGVPANAEDMPVSQGETAPPAPPALPDAAVGWLLLHARQHMQGRI